MQMWSAAHIDCRIVEDSGFNFVASARLREELLKFGAPLKPFRYFSEVKIEFEDGYEARLEECFPDKTWLVRWRKCSA